MDRDSLPNDSERLKDLVVDLALKNALLVQSNESQAREIAELQRQLYGRKSERICSSAELEPDGDGGGGGVDGEAPAMVEHRDPTAAETTTAHKTPAAPPAGKGNGRAPLPAKLPRVPVPAALPAGSTCSRCGGALRIIGATRSERLEWVPGHFVALAIARDKCVCPSCPSQGVRLAPPPAFALDRSLAGDGLLAKVIVDKFADHLPLNRQCRIFARHGVEIPVPTMCGWLRRSADLLRHVVVVMQAELLAGEWLQTDATGLPVLDGTAGQTHRGALWVYANDDHAVFEYTPDHESKNPKAFLDGFTGTVLADGTPTLDFLANLPDVDRAACWSHARRYFFLARSEDADRANIAIDDIRMLFMNERPIRNASPAERVRVRRETSQPILDKLEAWLDAQQLRTTPGGPLSNAIRYTRKRWGELTLFVDNGDIPIHNNASELDLRGPVIGRKNWLFAGSTGGAVAAAVFFSVVTSCRMQGVDPWVYLRDVLWRIPDATNAYLANLTPRAWAVTRRAQLQL